MSDVECLMDRPVCRLDDITNHGGRVIKVSGSMSINGHHNERVGDWLSCPDHGDNQMTEGCSMLDEGVPVVLHQCKTACGSVLIAAGDIDLSE